jgi:TetR/AcrR family acrAB operon transcriptional repressor
MPGRREETTTESRRRLVEATIELCAERGPRAFTVNDIAERAGISRGSIPHHFGSKDGLIVTMVEQVFATAAEEMAQRLAAIEAPTVEDIIAAHDVDAGTAQGKVFAGIHQEALFPDTSILPAYRAGWQRIRAAFAPYLAPLVERRPELGDVETLAWTLQSAIVGVNLQSHLDRGSNRKAAFDTLTAAFGNPPQQR